MITMDSYEYDKAHNYDLGELWGIFDKLPQNSSILDVGCGTGRILKFLRKTFPHKFDLYGVEKNEDLISEEIKDLYYDRGIGVAVGDFMNMDNSDKYDYLLFNSSIHQFPNTNKVLEHVSKIANKGIIIKTVDTAHIQETTISLLFPQLRELHFPIHQNITQPLREKHSFTLTLEKSVKYRLYMKAEDYSNLCLDRFISSLHHLTDAEILKGLEAIPNRYFMRTERMVFLMYEKLGGKK